MRFDASDLYHGCYLVVCYLFAEYLENLFEIVRTDVALPISNKY